MKVIKRNGKKEEFNPQKIFSAVRKAYDAENLPVIDPVLENRLKEQCEILSKLQNDISVESIQNTVEHLLMCYSTLPVFRAYVLYRERHHETREIRERLDYMKKYAESKDNASTSSETDPNANVTIKNVANLEGEVYKNKNRLIHRQRMKDKLYELYPEVAKQYEEDLNNNIIYAHDESCSPSLKNYTYSSKEVVEVLYNSKSLLLPLDLLYNIVDEPEILVDQAQEVYQKQPWNLYVKDINNSYVRVTHLTRKKRHRDLIRIKTAFGEDIVVTDNHPMITDITDKENLIPAINSLGKQQYRIGTNIKFKGKTTIDLCSILPTYVTTEYSFIKYQQGFIKKNIDINDKLGYIIGFFIGDGNYNNTSKSLDFSQKEKETLQIINEYFFELFGVAGKISKDITHDKYQLTVYNLYIYELFRGFFKIQDKAQNKTIPYNILEFNESFALGILAGLIDSDGTISKDYSNISIRLSSRACILQCTQLFRHFEYSIGNTIQSLPFSNNTSYHTNYTIWGISATKRTNSTEIPLSFKVKNNLTTTKVKSFKYHSEGYCTITNIDKIEEESAFLQQNEYIYDLTTESHTFCCNNILVHNCMAATLYPLMLEGTGNIDGVTPSAPNDIASFSGQVTNLVFLLSSQVRGAVACLYGEQPLFINGKIIKIKDFVNSKWTTPTIYNDWEYCKVNDAKIYEDGKYVDITKVYRKKYSDKIYKFTSYKGLTATTSKDHIFKVLRNGQIVEVKAENIRPFETVIVNNTIPFDYASNEYKEGWIKGMLLGDGCINIPDSVQLSINYDQDYYGEIFNNYITELYDGKLNKCKGHKCWNYCTGNRDLIAKLKTDIIGNNTYDKFIDITNKSLTYQVGLLDGILCADGGDYHCIGISLVNKSIIDSVKKILENLHIKYSYKEIPEHGNKQTLYCLNIEKSALKYLPNLKLKIKEKRKSEPYYHSGYAKVRKSRRGTNEYIESNRKGHYKFPQYTTDVIINIETFDNTDDYVYEIETSTHWYNCGGFITHNCGDYFIALNYYVIKEFGDQWHLKLNEAYTSENCVIHRTIKDAIRKGMKSFIYGINQPAGNRSYNSPFTNVSYYDKYYFESLFDGFYYPDGTKPQWVHIDILQRIFMELHRELRLIKPLTFPVSTMALLHDGKDMLDQEYKNLCAEEWAKGGSFFLYTNNSPTALSSCCKVLNEIQENTFSSTIGMTGIMTGSCNVITLNLNRIVQNWYRYHELGARMKYDDDEISNLSAIELLERFNFKGYLTRILERVYKYQIAYKTMLYDMEDLGMYSSSNAGYIYTKKLYSTIGLIGYFEAAQYLGLDVLYNTDKYVEFLQLILSTVKEENKKHSIHDKKRPHLFNSEAIPGENLGVKFYEKDKADGYWVPRNQNLYNCYFYSPWSNQSILKKLSLHGKETCGYCDGGQSCHLNLQEDLSKEQYLKIIDYAISKGVNYFTFNVPFSECKDCGNVEHIALKKCPKCGSENIDWWTRIIGYLRPVSAFSNPRQIEQKTRVYHNKVENE